MEENSLSEIFNYNSRKGFFYLNDILSPRKMTFDEAFNKLLADYQPEREEKWLSNLRSTYNIKVYQENLRKAYEEDNTP